MITYSNLFYVTFLTMARDINMVAVNYRIAELEVSPACLLKAYRDTPLFEPQSEGLWF
jgi:hypothetical protein